MELKSKKVLVTGADGFIGSHLVEMLVKKGCKVKALSYYNSFNSRGWLDNLDCVSDIEVFQGDVRDGRLMEKITEGIEIIFHIAALIAIPYSYIAVESYVDTNIMGTLNLCQAALKNNCIKMIHTSTSEVYGTARYIPIDEKHPIQSKTPYSASKIGADCIAESFYYSFNLPITIVRPFNTYGPRQSREAVIPTIINQVLSGQKELRMGSLSNTRDFIFVHDTINAFIMVAESDKTIGEVINIGSNREISIKELATLILKIMCSDAKIVVDRDRIRPDGSVVRRLCCNNTKIKELTGFQPQYTLEEGLKKTVAWYKKKEKC